MIRLIIHSIILNCLIHIILLILHNIVLMRKRLVTYVNLAGAIMMSQLMILLLLSQNHLGRRLYTDTLLMILTFARLVIVLFGVLTFFKLIMIMIHNYQFMLFIVVPVIFIHLFLQMMLYHWLIFLMLYIYMAICQIKRNTYHQVALYHLLVHSRQFSLLPGNPRLALPLLIYLPDCLL